MNISSKGYVATPAEISELTRELLSAELTIGTGRNTYLRALIGTTTHRLGLPPRAHARKAVKLTEPDIQKHVATLDAVHLEFLAAVTEAASVNLPVKDKALELNRRTGFARSAASTVRSYIKAGHDITALVPARVVKAALYVKPKVPKPPSPTVLKKRAEKRSRDLVSSLLALGERDQAAAAAELELLMGQLTDQLAAITGAKPTAQWKALTKDLHNRTQVLSRATVQAALS